MAEYKEIRGTKIRNYTTNPDNPITGEVWYNDTDNVLKFQFPAVTTSGSWRTANPVNSGRNNGGGFGIYTSALFFGGTDGTDRAYTEFYNGTNWTEVNDLPAARQGMGSFGAIGTAGLSIGGGPADVQVWNGTNWTEVNNINTARAGMASSKQSPSTSGLIVSGAVTGTPSTTTEVWNGTNWTEVNDVNTGKNYLGGSGETSTAALKFGGKPTSAVTELWNGTN